MRQKVLVSLSPDVLAVVDARAEAHRMTRSAYIAAATLGLFDGGNDAGTATARGAQDAERVADLVVHRGIVTKNRLGSSGGGVPLPDGCYYLVRVESRRKKQGRGR